MDTHVLPGADLPSIVGYDVVTNLPRAERFRERQSLGSGGIAVLVRSDSALAQRRGQLCRVSEHGTHLWLRFQQTGMRIGETLFLCLAYLPPRGSVFWERGVSETDVFAELESEIAEMRCTGEVLLAGDFNARIGRERDWIETEDIERHAGLSGLIGEILPDGLKTERRSEDLTVNGRGRMLLQLLRGAGLSVLNGRARGDEDGVFTSIRTQGKSAIDLFIASPELAGEVLSLEVLDLLQELSDHRPVLLTVGCENGGGSGVEQVRLARGSERELTRARPRGVHAEGCLEFRNLLKGKESDRLKRIGERGATEGAALLHSVLQDAGIAAFGKAAKSRGNGLERDRGFPCKRWFDSECKQARRKLRDALCQEGSAAAEELRKHYRGIVRRKMRMFSKARTAQLVEMAKRAPQQFWKAYRKRKKRVGVASRGEWFDYCRGLYTGEAFQKRGSDRWRAEELETDGLEEKRADAKELNAEFTAAEIRRVIEGMKKRKAADSMGFTAELLQAGGGRIGTSNCAIVQCNVEEWRVSKRVERGGVSAGVQEGGCE